MFKYINQAYMFVYKKINMYIYIVLYRYIDIFLGRGRIKKYI